MEFLFSKKLRDGGAGASTLKYVDVQSIKDDTVVLNNGALRAVLLVSSLNFDLKSSDEQEAIIGAYQNFLNSLDFPLQIVVSSRKFNITPYLAMLEKAERAQRNELLRLQTAEYHSFIKNLTEVSNIMTKSFYVVIPFAPVESKRGGFLDRVSGTLNPRQTVLEHRELFETYKNQLFQRLDHVAAGLSATGVRVTALSTDELIELLYNAYNPSSFTHAIIKDIANIEIEST